MTMKIIFYEATCILKPKIKSKTIINQKHQYQPVISEGNTRFSFVHLYLSHFSPSGRNRFVFQKLQYGVNF